MAEQLRDWADPRFVRAVLKKHPAPKHPETGEPLWDTGIILQGNQSKIINSKARFKQVRGGVRAGKSFIAGLAVYIDLLWRLEVSHRDGDRWGIVGDSYSMAEEEMNHLHRLLDEANIPHTFHTPERQSWKISFPDNTCEVTTLTSADISKIASRAYRGMVMAEAAQQKWDVYGNCRERVLQTRGWVLMEGTFEAAAAWYYSIAEEWQKDGAEGETFPLPSWENLVNFPGGREDPAILTEERERPPEVFLERYGGEPQKRSDRAMRYADERVHVRHRYPSLQTSFDPEKPVMLAIDPGAAHAYACLAFQMWEIPGSDRKPKIAWAIDAIFRWGRTAEQIIEEAAARPWAMNVQEAVMDFAGRQVRSEGAPNVEQWVKGWVEKTGHPLSIHANPVPLQAGYDVHHRCLLNAWEEEAAQRTFNHDKRLRNVTNPFGPRIMFDPAAAAPLFGGMVDGQRYLGEYALHRKKKNREGTITSDEYVDVDNDAIKAINYFLYHYFGPHGDRSELIGFSSIPWQVVTA